LDELEKLSFDELYAATLESAERSLKSGKKIRMRGSRDEILARGQALHVRAAVMAKNITPENKDEYARVMILAGFLIGAGGGKLIHAAPELGDGAAAGG
jgi:hypothetical protein